MVVKKKRKDKNLHKNDLEKKANHKLHRTTGTKFKRKNGIKRVICICTLKQRSFSICIYIFFFSVDVCRVAEKWHFLAELCLSNTEKNAPRDYLSEGKNAEFWFFLVLYRKKNQLC